MTLRSEFLKLFQVFGMGVGGTGGVMVGVLVSVPVPEPGITIPVPEPGVTIPVQFAKQFEPGVTIAWDGVGVGCGLVAAVDVAVRVTGGRMVDVETG